jgi:hypothetical protein
LTIKTLLVERLTNATPGWTDWRKLIALVKSLDFEQETDEHLGGFFTSTHPLVFSDLVRQPVWPAWLPAYVPALYGMKADDWEMAGGYADSFSNQLAAKGTIFSPAGNDEELGYPLIDVPKDVYNFQSNSSGALFFINKRLDVLYPNSDDECFKKLDTLETFTRKNIRQVLDGKLWFGAYDGLEGRLLD